MQTFLHAEKCLDSSDELVFRNIYPSARLVVMLCGAKKENVVKIRIRPLKEGEESCYWGWWDNENQNFSMVWPSKVQSDMCFTYGAEAAKAAGKGEQMNVMVEEVEND